MSELTISKSGQASLGVCRKNKPIWGYDDMGSPICNSGATAEERTPYVNDTQSVRKPCQSRFRMANGRCRIHGGSSLVGVDKSEFGNGHRSTKMPRHLEGSFQRILRDPTLLSVQKDVAVAEVRLEELGAQLESGFDSSMIDYTLYQAERIQTYLDSEEGAYLNAPPEFMALLTDFLERIQDAHNTASIWDDIKRTTTHKSRLIQIENGILKDAKNSISAEEAKILVTSIVIAFQNEAASWNARILNALNENKIQHAKDLLRTATLIQQVASRVRELTSVPADNIPMRDY